MPRQAGVIVFWIELDHVLHALACPLRGESSAASRCVAAPSLVSIVASSRYCAFSRSCISNMCWMAVLNASTSRILSQRRVAGVNECRTSAACHPICTRRPWVYPSRLWRLRMISRVLRAIWHRAHRIEADSAFLPAYSPGIQISGCPRHRHRSSDHRTEAVAALHVT